jgi:CheY-like chemotaxis protein
MYVVPSSPPAPRLPAVLVVEDDVLVRTIAAAFLRDGGLDVVEAGDADEAIRLVEAGVEIGVVFSDVNMPGSMDGFGLAAWLRQHRPEIKIILASGATRTVEQADAMPAHGPVLAKPYHHEELTQRIKEMIGL